MKPDIIVSWPRNCDYPLWRQFIHDCRSRFNEVIISFTETNQGDDFVAFVKEAMVKDYCLFVDIAQLPQGDDWRNYAVNRALLHSYNAEWIWFTEQDFLITDKLRFWECIESAVDNGAGAIGMKDAERLHPACLFMKRDALQKTNKNFGIVKDRLDHFGMIARDIEMQGIKLSILPPNVYEHMNGLSHNFAQIARGEKPNYRVAEFNEYLSKCLEVTVAQNERFNAIVHAYLATLGTTPLSATPPPQIEAK